MVVKLTRHGWRRADGRSSDFGAAFRVGEDAPGLETREADGVVTNHHRLYGGEHTILHAELSKGDGQHSWMLEYKDLNARKETRENDEHGVFAAKALGAVGLGFGVALARLFPNVFGQSGILQSVVVHSRGGAAGGEVARGGLREDEAGVVAGQDLKDIARRMIVPLSRSVRRFIRMGLLVMLLLLLLSFVVHVGHGAGHGVALFGREEVLGGVPLWRPAPVGPGRQRLFVIVYHWISICRK